MKHFGPPSISFKFFNLPSRKGLSPHLLFFFLLTVFLNAMPVTRFDADEKAEGRQGAIQLVELGFCSKTIADEICGFHRNTAADLLKTKELLGLEAVLVESSAEKDRSNINFQNQNSPANRNSWTWPMSNAM